MKLSLWHRTSNQKQKNSKVTGIHKLHGRMLSLAMAGLLGHTSTLLADNMILPDEAYHVRYDTAGQIPDHVAFVDLLQNLSQAESAIGRQENIAHIRTHLNLNERRAGIFLDHALESYQALLRSNRSVTNRMLCQGGDIKTEVAYNTLDVLDDLKEATAKQLYKQTIISFGSDFSQQLDMWLASIKEGSSHHKFDHRVVFELNHQSVEKAISTACQYIAALD